MNLYNKIKKNIMKKKIKMKIIKIMKMFLQKKIKKNIMKKKIKKMLKKIKMKTIKKIKITRMEMKLN
jgi:hypothetical protein